jgi:hypothetical protein
LVKLAISFSDKIIDFNISKKISEYLMRNEKEGTGKVTEQAVNEGDESLKEKVMEIVQDLKENRTASMIDLSNYLKCEGLLKSITKTLKVNASLVTLYLCKNIALTP